VRSYGSFRGLLLAAVLVGLAACASSGREATSGTEPGGDGISIRVNNDITPPASVVIWVLTRDGTRHRLGSVPLNGRREFKYAPSSRDIPVQLLAEPEGPATGIMGGTKAQQSNEFSLLDVRSVTWTVSRPEVIIGR
jgi:hypothetical protein